ncbi:MAG: alpha/beta hydrolase [Elusimicrobia bacterium]|nr:alpha/beta hydrolase [Elusimicrobiota bacterium]
MAVSLCWLGLRWFERAQLFIPSREMAAHPGSFGLAYETVRLTAADGVALHGWLVPGERHAPVVLLLHGNGGNISHRAQKAALLRGLGYSVFLLDYRGYGRSEGRPSEQGTYRDAMAAFRYLREVLGVHPNRLVYYGESLGCGVAVDLALRRPPAALILESPFTSVVDMGRLVFPMLPVRWLVFHRYDNLAKIPEVAAPLLVLHSPDDEIVPFEMGRRVYEAAREPKAFAPLRGSHNDGYLEAGARYAEEVERFLRAHART